MLYVLCILHMYISISIYKYFFMTININTFFWTSNIFIQLYILNLAVL